MTIINKNTGQKLRITDLTTMNLRDLGRSTVLDSTQLMVFRDPEKAMLAAIMWVIEKYSYKRNDCTFDHTLLEAIITAMDQPRLGLSGPRLEIRGNTTNGKHSIIQRMRLYQQKYKNQRRYCIMFIIFFIIIIIIFIVRSLPF